MAAKSILNIEDNFENRLLIKRLLQSAGFDVLEADDAEKAMEIIKYHTPDLILMDINMPDVDGYTLTNHLKSLPGFSKIPIVAITANVMKGDREKTIQAGCDGYIEKPIDIDSFLDTIDHFLSNQK